MPNGVAQERVRERAGIDQERGDAVRLVYGVDERPRRLSEALLYGWQHTLVDISPFILPLAVAAGLGLDAVATARMISFGLMAMGLATLLQTTIGSRLPIIQGPSATLVGVIAPLASQVGAAVLWGAVFVGAILEALIGVMRLVGWLRQLLPPVVSGTVIVAIGLSLGHLAIRLSVGEGRGVDLLLAALVIGTVLALQLGARRVLGGLLSRAAVFLSIWGVGLGIGSALGEVDWTVVRALPWFELPQLFPYGGPGFGWEFSLGVVLVVLAGYLGSMVESLGDYAATCEVAGVEYTERHMNRGIFAEGLGSALAAMMGALPCTSYTQNIGIIATTRVASRFVVRLAAGVLLLYGLCPKFGGLLVAMPRPVLGGVFVLICGSIVVAGVRLLLRDSGSGTAGFDERDALVVGPALVLAVALPTVVQQVLGAQWLATQPVALSLLLTNGVVIAMSAAVVLHLVVRGRRGEETSAR